MTTIPTIFDADELNDLIDLRNQTAQLTTSFYIAANHANHIQAPHLADLCYQIAELLTKAKVRADQAILAAASEKPVLPQRRGASMLRPIRAPTAPKGPVR
jgi:hypothetical protein